MVRISKSQARGRGKGWSTTELDTMLSVVEQLLPMGSNQWDAVQLAYARRLPPDFPVREAEAMKRKFYKLKNLPKPTGDADCPEEVRRAKRAFRLIENRGGVQDLDDEDDDGLSAATFPLREAARASSVQPPEVDATVGGAGDALPASPGADHGPQPSHSTVSSRSGLTPEQLLSLSSSLATPNSTTVSQSAQKRRRLDVMIDRLEAETANDVPPSNLVQLFVEMEEKSRERELEYRREREERDMQREERLRLEQQQREERDAKKDELIFALFAKMAGAHNV